MMVCILLLCIATSYYFLCTQDCQLDESHNPHLDLGSIIGSLDILEFMVWELVAGATNPTGYYIENGISKRYCDGVDIICRHLIGYVFIGLLSYSHPM